MRISSNCYSTLYNDPAMMQKSQNQARTIISDSDKNNYDEISIHSASVEELDSDFASQLKTALMKEIKQPSSQETLDNLKQRIENGLYQVDSNKVAERILLYKGE